MKRNGFAFVYVVIGLLWVAIIVVYALILFFPISLLVEANVPDAEVFVGIEKLAATTPCKISPLPAEGSWITVFSIGYFPYCVEYTQSLPKKLYAPLEPANGYNRVAALVSVDSITALKFSFSGANERTLDLSKYGGFLMIITGKFRTNGEDGLRQFMQNCYPDKEIVITHI